MIEEDLTHLNETLELHDLKKDVSTIFENRCLHHHVFDIDLLDQIMNFIEMKVIISYSSPTRSFYSRRKIKLQ